jgi:hypothetical protein
LMSFNKVRAVEFVRHLLKSNSNQYRISNTVKSGPGGI